MISEGDVNSGRPQVTVRVSGSPLTRGQQDAAMDPASILKEVNAEMSNPTMMMQGPGPVVMSQAAAQLGFANAGREPQKFGGK